MIAVLGVHLAIAVAVSTSARRLGPGVFWICALAPLATVSWLALHLSELLAGEIITESLRWVPALDLELALRVDAFSAVLLALIGGIGVAVFVYASRYFGPRRDLPRLAGALVLFAGAMVGVVTADNLLALFVFWELTTITSYALIGIDDDKPGARAAALQAILVTATMGLAMLGGFVLLADRAGTWSLSEILADPPTGTATSVAVGLILLGALAKSAQFPFHFWLPGAMAAPTPISAYLHSATMVKAGIYLIARLAPTFAPLLAWWRPTLITLGAITMVWGGYRALRQNDIKLLLAFGTVSQLGFMTLLFGAGYPELSFAGVAVLVAHGLFKATLFLVVGIVDHQVHTRDLQKLSGVGRRMRPVLVVGCIGAASMAGFPPLVGFVAKEAALEGLLHAGTFATVVAVVIGSVLTVAYSARFVWGTFADKPPRAGVEPLGAQAPLPSASFVAAPAVLAAITVVAGFAVALTTGLVEPAAAALDAEASGSRLYLWHGPTPALGLSLAAIAAGAGLFIARDRVSSAQAQMPTLVRATAVYERCVASLISVSERTTGVVQHGSLPIYLGVILATTVALPGWYLISATTLPDQVRFADSPLQVGVALVVVTAALATAMARRRFVAVLLLGAVGFGVAVLFVLQGAPDLALTQLLIETLTLVIFVLVLRHLPERFELAHWRPVQAMRIVVAVAVGVFTAAFTLIAAQARTAPSVSEELLARSLPEAEGRNVVNVILVDFRGYDTLGEITVLVVAALGIASLVALGRRDVDDPAGAPPLPTGPDATPAPAPAQDAAQAEWQR